MVDELQNERTVRRFLETTFQSKELSEVSQFFTEDAVIHNGQVTRNLAEYLEFHEPIFEAYPDYSIKIEEVFASDSNVAFRFSDSGTFENQIRGRQPTGEQFFSHTIGIAHMDDRKIQELYYEFDSFDFLQQVNVLEQDDI